MAVMMPREKWTDERLDDLQVEMRAGFVRVDGEIKELRRDLNQQVNGMRGEMNSRFDKVDARFDALNRNLIAGLIVLVAALIASNAF
jgi:hypothetical protein